MDPGLSLLNHLYVGPFNVTAKQWHLAALLIPLCFIRSLNAQMVLWICVPFVGGHIGLLKVGREPDGLNLPYEGRLMVEFFLIDLAA